MDGGVFGVKNKNPSMKCCLVGRFRSLETYCWTFRVCRNELWLNCMSKRQVSYLFELCFNNSLVHMS